MPDVLLQSEASRSITPARSWSATSGGLLTFNDDIRTAAVTLATVLAAADAIQMPLPESTGCLILGAGYGRNQRGRVPDHGTHRFQAEPPTRLGPGSALVDVSG